MNIGDYVRTEKGIFQIRTDKIHKERGKKCIGISGRGYTCLDVELIEKSSPNIIDLIEVGDYVNGGRVFLITDGIDKHLRVADEKGNWGIKDIYEEDIKSIITREQIESMQYKVKE